MLAVDDARHRRLGEERLEQALSFGQRGTARVETVEMQEVKGVVHHSVTTPSLEIILERSEIGPPVGVGRDNLAVNDKLDCGQAGDVSRYSGKTLGPVQPRAREQRHSALV